MRRRPEKVGWQLVNNATPIKAANEYNPEPESKQAPSPEDERIIK
jgi:hypothetical protein